MKSCKEITIDYLESVKTDIENAYKYCNKDSPVGASIRKDIIILTDAIEIVKEAEGEWLTMNLVEIKKLLKVQKLLNRALEGKVENRVILESAKHILDDVMEFKDITPQQAWKFGLEED